MVKPSRPKSSARKTCAARSPGRGSKIRRCRRPAPARWAQGSSGSASSRTARRLPADAPLRGVADVSQPAGRGCHFRRGLYRDRFMSSEFIYTMYKVSRTHPPDQQVLTDISLSFYPGAKIGVLGYNGAGKSTLLRIMAGVDTDYRGDAELHPNATVGMLEQEPQLDESKDVRGNVEDGVRELRD